jgi:hypothetical protein
VNDCQCDCSEARWVSETHPGVGKHSVDMVRRFLTLGKAGYQTDSCDCIVVDAGIVFMPFT